jgi:hypothetical protein
MPTPIEPYAAVAYLFGDVSENDMHGVEEFFEKKFSTLPAQTRMEISEWLITTESTLDEFALAGLRAIASRGQFAAEDISSQIATDSKDHALASLITESQSRDYPDRRPAKRIPLRFALRKVEAVAVMASSTLIAFI